MLTVQLKNDENAAGACESDGNVKEVVKHLCVHSEKKRREIIQKENNNEKKSGCGVCSRGGGEEGNRGDCLSPWPLPGPSQKPTGVPGFLRKNISASITPEPSAGLFTLARLPDSFTDVTYRHTGTLSQKGSRSAGRAAAMAGGGGGGEEQNR